jgi:hypothetical protein
MTKVCTKCNLEKSVDLYSKHKITKDGLRHNCKACCSAINKQWNEKNPRVRTEYQKEYKKKNHESYSKVQKKWERSNPQYHAKYKKQRRENDIEFYLTEKLRNRLYSVIKGFSKSSSTLDLLGCSLEQLRSHIESQFTEGMSWDKFGFYGIHIDHIIPCASFDMSDPEQQRQCFHYKNLQPLWWRDNLKKGDKMPQQLSTTKRCHGAVSTTN